MVVIWMSVGAAASPAPPHACVIATGSAVGLMLASPAADPLRAPLSVNAAAGATRVSEMVNLIVPYRKVTLPVPESVSALQDPSGVDSVVCQLTGASFRRRDRPFLPVNVPEQVPVACTSWVAARGVFVSGGSQTAVPRPCSSR